MSAIVEALASYEKQGTFRSLRSQGGLIDFASNDYLGLSKCSRIRESLIRELESGCPLGSTGSRLLGGQTKFHERVEKFLTETFQFSSALLFSSGFMANMGVFSAFGKIGAHFFSDEHNHASIVDGMRLARSPKTVFRHNDLNHLEQALKESAARLKVIATESVFSMGGDLAPLQEISELAERFHAWLIVDEAHATGIFGVRGLGRLEEIKERGNKIISIHTGGKALGGQGAFVLSSQDFRSFLINEARTFIFSTALSPLNALQIEFALKEVVEQPERGLTLLRAARTWRDSLPSEFQTLQSRSQIVPIVIGSNEQTLKVSEFLRRSGFDVRAIRSPTVPLGTERLRITFKSYHLPNEHLQLRQAFREAIA